MKRGESMYNLDENPYKIQIASLPEKRAVYDYRKDMSKKIKTAVIATLIASAALGGVMYQSHVQNQKAEEAMEVIYSEDLQQLPGIKFEITRNGTGYYVDEQGRHMGSVNGVDAQERANQYIESGYINVPSKTK